MQFQRLKKWATPRTSVLKKLENAITLAAKGKYEKADKIIQKTLNKIPADFETPFKTKAYALSAFAYIKLEDYPMAWNLALKATKYMPDYYVAYKIAGIAGLREESKEGYKVAERAFEACLYGKYKDKDYNTILRRKPIDDLCLKGALIASCRLHHEDKCHKYCKIFYKKFGGFTKSVIKYCLR